MTNLVRTGQRQNRNRCCSLRSDSSILVRSIAQWGAVVLIRHAHVDQAVQRDAVPGQAFIYRRLFEFRPVGEFGGHRIRRIRWLRRSGLPYGLRF
jgi:hypothetical protein